MGGTVKRENWIDSVKGIGILLVIVGHAHMPAQYIIYGFHMPLFFLLSGYLYHEPKNWGGYIKSKFYGYIVPYMILSAVNFMISVTELIMAQGFGMATVKQGVMWCIGIALSLANSVKTPNCTPLWFLVGLFLASMIFTGLLKIRSKKLRLLICAVMWAVQYTVETVLEIHLVWNIGAAMLGSIFMYIGYTVKNRKLLDNSVLICVLFVIGIVADVLNTELSGMASGRIGNPILFMLSGTGVSLGVIRLCRALFDKKSYISWIGQNTMLVMGFNYRANDLSRDIWMYTDVGYTWYIEAVTVTIVLSLVILAWIYLKKRVKLLNRTGF